MSEELDWVLDLFAAVVDDVAANYTLANGDPVVLKRVDRDDSLVYDSGEPVDMSTPIHKRSDSLQSGAFVGVSLESPGRSPQGFDYNVRLDTVLSVRVEGMTYREYGHIDPRGEDGIPFAGENGLVDRLQGVLESNREYPDITAGSKRYETLFIENEDRQSSDWTDFYRTEFDVRLKGRESLP